MTDIWLAVGVMAAITIGLTAGGVKLGRRLSRRAAVMTVAGLVLLLVGYVAWCRDAAWLVWLAPVTAAIVYSNPLLPLTGLIVGLFYGGVSGIPRWRRLVLSPIVLALAGYTAVLPLVRTTPRCLDQWSGDVCLQTSSVTCTPSAAATLLRYHGIDVTEAQMARLCLTGPDGTSMLGLYRGLRIKADAAGRHVRAGVGDIDELRDPRNLPAIIDVRLDADVDRRNPMYSGNWGWQLGVTHTVVLYAFTDDNRIEIGDPGVGREHWDLYSLDDLWHGAYVTLSNAK